MKIALLLLLSGIASVDRNAAFNLMISRPVVLSTIIGILFGNPTMCFMVGVLFEMIGLVDVPVGTHIPRDDTFAAYTFSLLIGFNLVTTVSDALIALLLIILFIHPVTFTDKLTRKLNKTLFLNQKKKNHNIKTKPLIIRGIIISFIRGIIVYNLFFVITAFLLIQLKLNNFNDTHYEKYLFLSIVFLAGFLLRFLSFKSIYKYIIFIAGLFLGWIV